MVRVLVLTHGSLADELVAATRTIDTEIGDAVAALSLEWDADFEEARAAVVSRLRELDTGEGVLVLTDMFGGTATNLVLPSLTPDRVEVVTGVNLPMLVKFASLVGKNVALLDLARRLTVAGQKSIHVTSDFLKSRSSS